ncbi:nitroreductase family protein [Galactobacter caseinivorans]|nr:nitroreductase family protein [Galactobacter caseinivorans]
MHPRLHPALARRFSPVRFDPQGTASSAQVDVWLDAARKAPAAGNSQPWMIIMVNLAHVLIEGTTDWECSEFSRYDLGQAVAHMSIQGLAVGLDAHQFRAFGREAVAAEFGVPSDWKVASMTAFGVAAHAAGGVAAPGNSRERATIRDITWARI